MKNKYCDYYNKLQKKICKDETMIKKDVDRTFPQLQFFDNKSKGYIILCRILRALSITMKNVGYCQGMNFLAATIYLNIGDEEMAFWMLVHLLKKDQFKEIFSPGLDRLNLVCYQLECLISKYLPKIGRASCRESVSSPV